jgi:stress response protein YsnF
LIVPVYEEQLVVVKRLVMREHLRIRRIGTTETQLFEDRLPRERLSIEDPAQTGLVREVYPSPDEIEDGAEDETSGPDNGILQRAVRGALQ